MSVAETVMVTVSDQTTFLSVRLPICLKPLIASNHSIGFVNSSDSGLTYVPNVTRTRFKPISLAILLMRLSVNLAFLAARNITSGDVKPLSVFLL